VKWQRTVLTFVLMGSCVWCVFLVQGVQSEETAGGEADLPPYRPVAPAETLLKAQEEHLEAVKTHVAADEPSFIRLAEHAFVAAEFYNILQYYQKLPEGAPSPAQGREAAEAVARAAKDRNAQEARLRAARLEKLPPAPKDSPDAGAPPLPYKPVASVHNLMEVQQDHFDELKKELRAEEPDFDKVLAAILVVAELSNVNQYQSKQADFQEWAVDTRDVSLQLARAAREKDASASRDLVRQVHASCVKCHDKYQ
jgi:hypothetical protein